MITVEDALARVLALACPLANEIVPLVDAAGRSMTVPARAMRAQPPFPASAMDGYAVMDPVSAGQRLTVIGMAAAGHAFHGTVHAGQAVRIFTGAPVPAGATRVIIQEDVSVEGTTILIGDTVETSTNIRAVGQDFKVGDTISARRLRPNDLALLASMNLAEVTVARRPIVAFVATGDELVMPGESPPDDQIIASNAFALKAMAEAEGAEARLLPIARDSIEDLTTVLGLVGDADLVVTIGGASVGDHDLVARVAAALGMEQTFYKVAMRPGKPIMAGRLRGVPLLGLPGNPVSAIVCGHLFLLPMIRAMQSLPAVRESRRAILLQDLPANGPRTHYMRARLSPRDGLPGIRAFERQDSALLSILSEADALLIRPIQDPARPAGAEVDYLPL